MSVSVIVFHGMQITSNILLFNNYLCSYIYKLFEKYIYIYMKSLIAQLVKNLPSVQKTRVQSLGQEDPPEKEMATCSSILAWKILWTEEPGELQSMGSQESDTT